MPTYEPEQGRNEKFQNEQREECIRKVGNYCYRRMDVTDEAVMNKFNCIEQIY